MSVSQLIEQIGSQQVGAFFLVLARISPLFVLAPLFGSKLVPARVRGIVAVALSIGLTPVVAKMGTIPVNDAGELGMLIAKEMLIGFAFAYAIGALFAAVSVAGGFLDTLIGFSYGSLVDPLTGNQSTILLQLYSMFGTLVFIVIGGDAWVVRGLARTYEIVGPTQLPDMRLLIDGALGAFTQIFVAAIEVAGPVMLALVVVDAAFGVVSRVVPQLNVFAVGFPAKVIVGLVLVGATLPFVGQWIAGELQQDVAAALQSMKVAG